jgi:hypothetical protein
MDHVCVVKWWSCWAFPCINFLFYICAGNNILHERYVIYIFFKCNGWLLVWIILSLWATSFFLVWFFICFCLFLICLNSFSFCMYFVCSFFWFLYLLFLDLSLFLFFPSFFFLFEYMCGDVFLSMKTEVQPMFKNIVMMDLYMEFIL